MNLAALPWLVASFLFVAVLGLLETGRRYGRRRAAQEAEGARPGLGVVDGAVFGLLGLLLAFSFSGAASRFDNRRQLIVAEANAIGTAWLRVDLLPDTARPELHELLRAYTDARLELFRSLPDIGTARAAADRAKELQDRIWSTLVEACRFGVVANAGPIVLGAFNQMFDIATERNAALRFHPPTIILVMVILVSLIGAALAGYGMAGARRRSWLHVVGFPAILAFTVYVILDLEFPRAGLFRVDGADQVLIELRTSMK